MKRYNRLSESKDIYYHGTPNDFKIFDLKKQRITNEDLGLGISLTLDYNWAKQYALSDDSSIRYNKNSHVRNEGYIYYVKVKGKMYDMSTKSNSEVLYVYKKGKEYIYKEEYEEWENYDWDSFNNYDVFYDVLYKHFYQDASDVLQDLGYVGIISSLKEIRVYNPKVIKIIKKEIVNEKI